MARTMKFSSYAAAALVAVFFGQPLAEAIDFKFGAQIRPRFTLVDQIGATGFDSSVDAEKVWKSRVRFETGITLNENNSGFIQFQGIGIWGSVLDDDFGQTFAGVLSRGRSGIFLTDDVNDLGIHQAYFTVKNVYDIPVELQVGRQELVLDGHRLIGNVGWSPGGRSHDGVRLVHAGDNYKFLYLFSKLIELDHFDVSSTAEDPNDDFDFSTHFLWANFKGLAGKKSSTSLYFVYLDVGNFEVDDLVVAPGDLAVQNNQHFTVGLRQAGRLFGIDYRGEFYYQFGMAETYYLSELRPSFGETGIDPLGYPGYQIANLGAGTGIKRSAYMFGVRVGKRFSSVPWKPSITVWYDHLSGTDQDDINNKRFSTFGTLFASQHKFYGHMDLFYAGSAFFQAGQSTGYLGLRDLAIKGSIYPHKRLLINVAYHWFWTDTDLSDPANAALSQIIRTVPQTSMPDPADPTGPPIIVPEFVIDCECGPELGMELDITLVHRYNDWLTFSVGYSRYFSAPTLLSVVNQGVPTTGDLDTINDVLHPASLDDSDWVFAQFDWKF